MPIEFSCPGCGAKFRVNDEFGGKKTRCKKCEQVISIPHASAPAAPAAPIAPPVPVGPPSIPQVPAMATPRAAPKKASSGLGTLQIPEGLNVTIAWMLLFALVVVTAHTFYNMGTLAVAQMPEEEQSKFWVYLGVNLVGTILQHLLVFALVAWLCVLAATSFAKSSVAEPAYLMVAGAMACPTIGLLLAISQILNAAADGTLRGDNGASLVTALLLIVAGLVLAAVLLQALLHMNWKTSLISWVILVPVMLVTMALCGKLVTPKIESVAKSIAGMTKDSPDQQTEVAGNPPDSAARAREAREQAKAAAAQREAERQQQAAELAARRAADPLYGSTSELEVAMSRLSTQISRKYLEELQPEFQRVKAEVERIKPQGASETWERLSLRLLSLEKELAAAPSREVPKSIYEDATPSVTSTESTPDSDLSPTYSAYGWTFRIPKYLKPHLDAMDKRSTELRFSPGRNTSYAIVIKPLGEFNPKQKQPFVYSDDRQQSLGKDNLLLNFKTATGVTIPVKVGDRIFFNIPRIDNTEQGTDTYVVKNDKGWLMVQLQATFFSRNSSDLPRVRAFLSTFGPASAGGIDPYSPEQIVTQIDDDGRLATRILIDQGPKSIPYLQGYLEKSRNEDGRNWAYKALQALDPKLAGEVRETVQKGATLDGMDALNLLKSASNNDGRKEAYKLLANAKFNPAQRDEIAQELEKAMLADGAEWCGEEIAGALQVWRRPQTANALMPLIVKEDLHTWLKKPVIKSMAATGEKSAVKPVLRWIIKEPDTVVKAVVGMGPVAEDETIKLLSERDGNVRKNAARILMEIGTKKSMGPLQRASKDQRDVSAATIASTAYQMVKDRVAASTQPTTAPTP